MRAAYHPFLVVAAPILLGAPLARAEEPPATASMQCDRVGEPGRVKCSVEARTRAGLTLSWADVQLVELPDFTSALKGRIGPSDAVVREGTLQKWAFALVARRPGEGEARARVRVVVCADADGGPHCAPHALDVKAVVKVGP